MSKTQTKLIDLNDNSNFELKNENYYYKKHVNMFHIFKLNLINIKKKLTDRLENFNNNLDYEPLIEGININGWDSWKV